jgi:hypothetical protein
MWLRPLLLPFSIRSDLSIFSPCYSFLSNFWKKKKAFNVHNNTMPFIIITWNVTKYPRKIGFIPIVWPCIVADSLWIKPTDALNSSFVGITTLHVSGSLSACHQEFLVRHRLWYILCSCDDRLLPGVGWNWLHPTGNKGSSPLHNMYQSRCLTKNSWWWAERLPETCRVVIPTKLEFSTSVGFIH